MEETQILVTAKDIMTKQIITVKKETTLVEAD